MTLTMPTVLSARDAPLPPIQADTIGLPHATLIAVPRYACHRRFYFSDDLFMRGVFPGILKGR